MGAHRHHPATRNRLLVLVLGLAWVAAACGGPDARPTAASPKGGEVPALVVIPKGTGRSRA
jgi:hypothetical protein